MLLCKEKNPKVRRTPEDEDILSKRRRNHEAGIIRLGRM